MNLTVKQELFCDVYIESGNASEAYRKAYDCENMKGSTINRKAHELLENGKITARLEEMRSKIQEKSEIRKQDILDELRAIAFADIGDYVSFDGAKLTFKPFDDLTEAQRHAIESIKNTHNGIEIRLHGKNWSIDRICKMLGFDAPVVTEQRLGTGYEDLTDDEIKKRLMGIVGNDLQNVSE